MQTILVVEDEPLIAGITADYLRQAGFEVVTAGTGEQGLAMARAGSPALIVLDLRLPGISGLDVARALRRDSAVPIIMLTARVDESDRLLGLDVGADDYVTKPFSPRELVARVRAVLRRAAPADTDLLRIGDLTLDVPRMTVARNGEAIELTATEFQLLTAMARHPGRVFTRTQLLDAVRGEEVDAFDRAIDAHVKNIRRKIEIDPRRPRDLLTVYGVGYKCAEL
ncbi:MAG TPA: response regulator transcription factor [Vicinamibacterales bacterium]|nr:response regulator transcription factor [Vicinamibacterales bacterium]